MRRLFRAVLASAKSRWTIHKSRSSKAVIVEHDTDVAREDTLPNDVLIDTDVPREAKTSLIMSPEIETEPSSHDTLPNDVLIQIFVLISQDYGAVVFPIDRDRETPPQIALSHVCSRWRTLALGTFELWNNVCLVDFSQLCYEWLLRAGSSPIALSFQFTPGWDDDEAAWNARFMRDIVSRFKLQIKALEIGKLTDCQFKLLSSPPNDIFPHVKRIGLWFHDSYDGSSAPNSFTKLRSVSLSKRNPSPLNLDIFQNIHLPWHQLRCLKLHFHTKYLILAIFDILRQMPLLQTLLFCIRSSSSLPLASLTELTIPSLRSFHLILSLSVDDVNRVLRNIVCPALVEFMIRVDQSGLSKEAYEIIKRQYNLEGLEKLTLFESTIPASSILKDAPKLHELSVRNRTLDDEAIVGLSNGVLGRYLTGLTIPVCDTNRLLSMVEMRKRTVDGLIEKGCSWRDMITVLRDVRINSYPEHKYKERVDALKKAGIRIMLF